MEVGIAISAKQGRPVTCTKGCFGCCRELVYAERREAVELIERTVRDGLDAVARLWVLTGEWRDRFFKTGMHKVGTCSAGIAKESDVNRALQYRKAMLWCPLLKDGVCTQYEARPYGCRVHFATGPRIACEDDKLRPNQIFMFLNQECSLRLNIGAMAELTDGFPRAIMQFDHLGVWLAHILLGETRRSMAEWDAQFTPEESP
jgi:Fe-S-cluster containining protein